VSTPQDIALIDAARALHMFSKLNVPVLGIVENMASYACNACGAESHPFGHGGAEREAKRLDVPFLGRIPLEEAVREGGDSGTPSVRSHPESASSLAFADLAKQVAERLILDSDD
jgi:ATP-binding protein involved in chromosome partitioning